MITCAPGAGCAVPAYVWQKPDEVQSAQTSTGINWEPDRSAPERLVRLSASDTPGSPFSEAELATSIKRIKALLDLEEDWNGHGIASPDPQAVVHALARTIELYQEVVARGGRWTAPNATASPKGDAVLEWWNGRKKLTLYVSLTNVEYVKSWGSDIDNEMEDGSADAEEERLALWNWLVS